MMQKSMWLRAATSTLSEPNAFMYVTCVEAFRLPLHFYLSSIDTLYKC